MVSSEDPRKNAERLVREFFGAPKQPQQADPAQIAEMMAKALTSMEPIVEGMSGLRRQFVAAGFSEAAAEQMVVTTYISLLGLSPR